MDDKNVIKPKWDPKKGLVAKPASAPTKVNKYKDSPLKSAIDKITQEVYNQVMNELDDALPPTAPAKGDVALGTTASKLAQLKGELSTRLDRAEREKIVSRRDGKISIINLPKYIQVIGDLPKQIKALQAKIQPNISLDNEED